MAAKISFKDDVVSIQVDGSSRVRNIRVRGKKVMVDPELGWSRVLERALFYVACFLLCVGFWYALFLLFASDAHGQTSGQCELIKDHDQRQYCRACATGRVGTCEFIKDRDLRYRCRALCKSNRN